MLHWLFLLPLFIPNVGFSETNEVSSRGPTYEAEAAILWEKSIESLKKSQFDIAVPALQRLVDRYPAYGGNGGYEGNLDSRLLLGQALLKRNRPKEALAPLKYYIEATSPTLPDAPSDQTSSDTGDTGNFQKNFQVIPLPYKTLIARVLLGQALLKIGRATEAYLLVLEIQNLWRGKVIPHNLSTEILLLNTQALFSLGKQKDAEIAISSARDSLKNVHSTVLHASVFLNDIEIQLKACSLLGNPANWTRSKENPRSTASTSTSTSEMEAQVLDQMNRRGTCLKQTLLNFRKIMDTLEENSAESAEKQIEAAYLKYRSQVLSSRFQIELRNQLLKNYKSSVLDAQELLTSWKQSLSPKMQPTLGKLTKQLQQTTKGIE